MTPADLRVWAQKMGYTTPDLAAQALGVSRATYFRLLSGPVEIDRRTALACAALAAGLGPYQSLP